MRGKGQASKSIDTPVSSLSSSTEVQRKDTGWIEITNKVKLPDNVTHRGKVAFRRIDNLCYLSFEGYLWTPHSTQSHKFLPDEICSISHPLWNKDLKIRSGGFIAADNRDQITAIYDWLGEKSFRYCQLRPFLSFALIHWVTDTEFPSEETISQLKQ